MTTPMHSSDQVQSTPTTQDIGDLSFVDYQKVRRGEATVESVQSKSAPAPEKGVEQKQSDDSDPSETEGKDEAGESEVEGDEPEAKDSEEDKPKKSGFQRRIDKLNQRASVAQQEAEYWKERALKGATSDSKHVAKDVEKPNAASVAGKPDPEKFETHAEYVEALTDWKLEQREQAKKADDHKAKVEAEQKALMKSHSERVQAFSKKQDDFQEVIEGVNDIPVSPALGELIVSSENGPELMYELAKNRAEYERINKLSPLAAARELGRIESKLSAKEESKPEPKKLTSAPKPIEPVGSGKGHVAKSLDDPGLSYSDYERMRRDQMKRKRG